MNTAKDMIKKLVDELPETKAGEVIDFLMYLKGKKEQDLYLSKKEEEEIWHIIHHDERISSDSAKNFFLENSMREIVYS